MKEEYWLWYWGVNQKKLKVHSKPKKFMDFNKMKNYSANHSAKHKWIGKGYWSIYDKIN